MAATLVMPKKEDDQKKEDGGSLQVSQAEQKEGAGLVPIERTFKPKKESKLGKMIAWVIVLIVLGGGGTVSPSVALSRSYLFDLEIQIKLGICHEIRNLPRFTESLEMDFLRSQRPCDRSFKRIVLQQE